MVVHHPLTGQWNERLDNVFVGWSDQDEEDNKKWHELRDRIESFLNLDIWDQYILDGKSNIILGPNMLDIETATFKQPSLFLKKKKIR